MIGIDPRLVLFCASFLAFVFILLGIDYVVCGLADFDFVMCIDESLPEVER